MKILVAVKRVADANVKVRPKADGTGVDLTNVKMAVNPFCEIAVEEAVRLKEAGIATEIVAVSVGDKTAQEQIRTALALGADRGILVETDAEVQPLAVAKALKAIVDQENNLSTVTTTRLARCWLRWLACRKAPLLLSLKWKATRLQLPAKSTVACRR